MLSRHYKNHITGLGLVLSSSEGVVGGVSGSSFPPELRPNSLLSMGLSGAPIPTPLLRLNNGIVFFGSSFSLYRNRERKFYVSYSERQREKTELSIPWLVLVVGMLLLMKFYVSYSERQREKTELSLYLGWYL